jgi:hypothetical protein
MAPKDKRDPAWLHCQLIYWKMVCNYCQKEVGEGGINRIKQYLAHARRNIKPCLEVSDELKAEMQGHLDAYQVEKAKNKKVQKEVGRSSSGTQFDSDLQGRMPSFEESSAFPIPGRDPYTNPREEHLGGSGVGASASKRPRGNLESFFVPHTTPGAQPTIDPKWKKIGREAAWEFISRGWYDADIPFNTARFVYYQPMSDAIASCGPGFKGPGYEDIRGNLLKNEVERVKEYLIEFKESWFKTRCTIMSDGWTGQRSRTILNFLISFPKGTMFLKSVDASDQVKDAHLLFRLLDEVVEKIGVQNVVQVITDNPSNYVATGRMLEEKHRTIWWTPCAAHCLDLMLEDIGKIEWVKKTVEQGKSIRYIYNHTWVLNLMRKKTGGKELVRSAITRFVTNFLTLQSMINQKANLSKMFSCNEWNASQWSKKAEGKEIIEKVYEKAFWNRAEEIVLFSAPLVKVLRMVDGDKPTMGFFYDAIDQNKEAIKEAYQAKRQKYLPLWRIIDERWNKQLHQPLHAARYYLNPR